MKKQQQGWQMIEEQQQSPQIINVQHSWLKRQQQEQTMKRQFQKIQQKQTGLPYKLYSDRKEFNRNKKVRFCLFHGTTNNQFESFIQNKLTWDFYLTPDLEVAIWYAKEKKKQTYKHDPTVLPAILVFKILNSSVLDKLFSDKKTFDPTTGYLTIRKEEDFEYLIKNSLVEMITLKNQTKQQSKQQKK